MEPDYYKYTRDGIRRELTSLSKNAVKVLLETRHLYQSVNFLPELKALAEEERKWFEKETNQIAFHLDNNRVDLLTCARSPWYVFADDAERAEFSLEGHNDAHVVFTLPRITTSCSFCGNFDSVHLPVSANDCSEDVQFLDQGYFHLGKPQSFAFTFSCQSCPENSPTMLTYMVTRKSQKVTLTGRSEFEFVDVPKCIPKEEKKFFSDAIISKNAGKPLAALFYLRTFVEQYLRRITDESGKSDGIRLAETYHSMLDEDFPSKFRCMRTVYEDLSAKIHAAEDDLETFEKCHDALVKHFNMLAMMPIKPEE